MDRFLKYLLISLTFIFLFCLFVSKVSNNDIWGHLKVGEYILTQHSFPQSDVFSYTIPDHPWILKSWFAQIIFYGLYCLGGVNALILFKIIFLMAIFIPLFIFSWHRTNYLVASFLVILTALVMWERFLIRPELFCFLFILGYLFILYHYKYHKSRLIYLLPLLQLFWVNMHPSFFIGFALMGTFLIGEFLNQRLKIPFCIKDEYPVKGRQYLKLLIIFSSIILVSFFNPGTYRTLLLPLTLTKSEVFMKEIVEWKSPFSEPLANTLYFKIIIAAVVAGFILNYKRLNFTRLLLFIIFLYLGMTARRHTALFALIMAPVIMTNLGEAFTEINGLFARLLRTYYIPLKKTVKGLAIGLLVIWLLFSIQTIVTGRFYIAAQHTREFGFGVNELTVPEGGINFIEEHNVRGNLFNAFYFGPYLIWRCYPERKVFIDSRLTIYGEEFFKHYLTVTKRKAGWKERLQSYQIDYFLLDYNSSLLLSTLYKEPDWKLVYLDDISLIFLKDKPENRRVIERYAIDLAEIPETPIPKVTRKERLTPIKALFQKQRSPIPYLNRGYLFASLGLYEKAEGEYKKALKACPYSSQAYNNLGINYYKQRRYNEAMAVYREALRLNPYSARTYTNLGNLYADQGRYDEAIVNYKKAIRISPQFALVHYNLGVIYSNKGWYKQAIIEYKKSLKIDPDNALAHYNLGTIYFNQWRYQEARKEWKKALEIEPRYKEARERLERLRKMGY